MNKTDKENVCIGALVMWLIGLVSFIAWCCSGCANTPSGVKVVASSASYTNVGDINWEEYKIPVFSIYLGPKAKVWVHKDFRALDEIVIHGTVTNTTSALGIYESDERKELDLRLNFREQAETNAVETLSATQDR